MIGFRKALKKFEKVTNVSVGARTECRPNA